MNYEKLAIRALVIGSALSLIGSFSLIGYTNYRLYKLERKVETISAMDSAMAVRDSLADKVEMIK